MANTIKIGINGFGRIGRIVARLAAKRDDVEIVGINDLGKPEQMLHLLKYDSVHGTMDTDVRMEGDTMILGRSRIKITAEKDPTKLPWGSLGASFVHECTGVFTEKEKAALHLQAGAKRVIISAPSKDADTTLCIGVNENTYDPSKHVVVSNASCTTNCLAPLCKVLDDNFGIVRGTMLTVHSYTNDQNVLDFPHKDLRRARAAAMSMIPTTTGAAKAVGLVIPQLKGKIDGLAVRVPTPNVSLVDFTGELKKSTTKEEINATFKKAAEGSMKGVLGFSTAPLVSIDFNGSTESSTIDADQTLVINGNLVKVLSWYDNETGFSARMLDLTAFMARKGL
ncbi:MAG: type I glyceraldehyde-3-phosphate dehydrogenase [Bdellovibrionales bacterium RIFOXYC1_FULL_54_43]|nr:MAG: type I glyceraldehyde-3-phosphate dehydrogenase [Bdellovibrionales bacterium RIFOXYC1_FULL_54_43]